jgi:shikimate kinase
MSNLASRPIVLVGMMGAGKTSVGRVIADRLGVPFCDLDQEIERRTGKRVADIFSEQGEESFRSLESGLLSEVLGEVDSPAVVSTGGGIVTIAKNREMLTDPTLNVVLLEASIDEILERLPDDDARPLLRGDRRSALESLWHSREAEYRRVAKFVVRTNGLSVDEVAQAVIRELQVAA